MDRVGTGRSRKLTEVTAHAAPVIAGAVFCIKTHLSRYCSMRSAVAAVFCFIFSDVFAQNLVPNPGFEQYRKIPPSYCHSAKEFNECMEAWSLPNLSTSDYFNSKCKGSASTIKNNFVGNQRPKEGQAYAGFYVYENATINYREYLQVKLLQPLKAGKTYDIRFYVSLSESSEFGIDRLGVLFLKKQSKQRNVFIIPKNASAESADGVYYDDKNKWMQVHMTFRANGGERFLVIGNFRRNDDMHLKAVPVNKKKYYKENGCYYYVDDVCVAEQDDAGNSICPCELNTDTVPLEPVVQEMNYDTASVPVAEKEQTFVLHSVFFDTDRWELKPESFPSLDSLAAFLLTETEYSIEIRGHTDNSGDESMNRGLSERRAEAVANYLVKKGVASSRVSYAGLGSAKPVADNSTPEGRAKNRRVEYILVKE